MDIQKISNRGWNNLDSFAKALFKDTYFLPNEDYSEWITRISTAFQNDKAHGERIATYIYNYWGMGSTPISSNGGTNRGLPIACYVGTIGDTKEYIFDSWRESAELGSKGGGEGEDWSNVREIFADVGKFGGKSSGIIPFACVDGILSSAISQGGIRRFSKADYLHISHPEIEEFIDIRKPTGDQSRRAPDIHHAIIITDKFMNAVILDNQWDLISPHTDTIIKTVEARKLWIQILDVRATLKGEPYLLFIDNVNKYNPSEYIKDSRLVRTSQLCIEIMLTTDKDRGNICALASVNAEYYNEWKNIPEFIPDWNDFLDNALQSFLDKTVENKHLQRFRRGAEDERSTGLGVMGFHSLLQKKNIPFESSIAKSLNIELFKHIKDKIDIHQENINTPCPMALRTGSRKRNIHSTSIAPTMSISTLVNVASSGIEPWLSNSFTKKVKQGAFPIRNKYLNIIIEEQSKRQHSQVSWSIDQWKSIKENNGSVQHLDWMSEWNKDVFKTAFELDQKWLLQHAADRTPFISQGQSLNIFIPGDSEAQYISDIHILAWRLGIKSLYYLRSTAVNMASTSSNERQKINTQSDKDLFDEFNKDSCLGCS